MHTQNSRIYIANLLFSLSLFYSTLWRVLRKREIMCALLKDTEFDF